MSRLAADGRAARRLVPGFIPFDAESLEVFVDVLGDIVPPKQAAAGASVSGAGAGVPPGAAGPGESPSEAAGGDGGAGAPVHAPSGPNPSASTAPAGGGPEEAAGEVPRKEMMLTHDPSEIGAGTSATPAHGLRT